MKHLFQTKIVLALTFCCLLFPLASADSQGKVGSTWGYYCGCEMNFGDCKIPDSSSWDCREAKLITVKQCVLEKNDCVLKDTQVKSSCIMGSMQNDGLPSCVTDSETTFNAKECQKKVLEQPDGNTFITCNGIPDEYHPVENACKLVGDISTYGYIPILRCPDYNQELVCSLHTCLGIPTTWDVMEHKCISLSHLPLNISYGCSERKALFTINNNALDDFDIWNLGSNRQ